MSPNLPVSKFEYATESPRKVFKINSLVNYYKEKHHTAVTEKKKIGDHISTYMFLWTENASFLKRYTRNH